MYWDKDKDLPPMKFQLSEKVSFKFGNKMLVGIIDIRDFGGSIEHDHHSYDILVKEENMLYKHIPERDVFKLTHSENIH
ncbi:hypothetical protein BK727_25295 [Bacillus thuringiensis serovar roskildiensis]|uniref:Uncharacterized protein n=1 Tax=Bacillus thuringiensis serovar sooncheon TaxID=180891 RepID=A0A9Q5SCS2_BACTU|nr:hypothetical protein [Bacillus thuringiensis]MEB9661179.1 hypothetical protein [Bacillus cereus]ARV91308.1 hypothetical protein BJG91_01185 [Bacillus thuringiensis]OTW65626.1 hypothetical protein BK707_28405 [Bacillus thuringiensis serovar coreanensis]OTX42491.1 hypothetical protein BK724_24225 [Bacillus thuringiensis serovar sooncheon]OTX54622.1 hypothetical protein BK725_13165 [Bacillus thuringiensis serovar guiyangiensis]